MIEEFIKSQVWLSEMLDRIFPTKFTQDGNHDFVEKIIPKYLSKNIVVYDIGGGKNPYLDNKIKKKLNIKTFGIDIDQEELSHAPEGVYDKTICCDITKYKGHNDADLVICQSLLEHVRCVESAFKAISTILKPNGIALIFAPSKNAIYARLNLILPQRLKKALLFFIFPQKKYNQGFPAYYNRCTPADFKKIGNKYGLSLVDERYFYVSSYFSFFFPFYLFWRIWITLFYLLFKEQAAETFIIVFKKG